MNKTFCLFIVLAFFACQVHSQVRIGPVAGVNASNFVGDQEQFYTENSDYKFGFNGGVAANFPLLSFLSLQAEFRYSQMGAAMNSEEDFEIGGFNFAKEWDVRTDMDYLKFPALGIFAIGSEKFKLLIEGGVYGAYLATSQYNDSNGEDFERTLEAANYPELDKQYKDWDVGYIGGVGLQFTVNGSDQFIVDARFSRSINSIVQDDFSPTPIGGSSGEFDQFNQAFTLSFSYLLNIGG